MRYTKLFAWLALAGGMAFMGATSAKAQDWRDLFRNGHNVHQDYSRVSALERQVAADRARLNEDIRCGRTAAARRDSADLARDQRLLEAARRDVRHNPRDLTNNYYRQGSYDGYSNGR